MVERNMCNAVMRGIAVPPGSKSTSRAKGSRRKLGYLVSDHRPCADLVRIGSCGDSFNMMSTSFFLGRQKLIASRKAPEMALWREKLFANMHRNAASAADFLNLPNNSVVELGSKIEI